MRDFTHLAFVDVETTGLDPRANRITEIGVVTVDAGRIDQWTTFVNPGSGLSDRGRSCDESARDERAKAPRFKDIAGELAKRLSGRLFIAHNARFDHGFIKAEFNRLGMAFCPDVVCSVMLSRKLYSQLAHHDLDSLVKHHALTAEARHRALPDAQLVWQFWQVAHRDYPAETVEIAIDALLAGPVLPAHMDRSLIDRLPEAPGVYVFHGEGGQPLQVGKAANLKLHILRYFRIDVASARAIEISHRIANITWRATQGMLGAQFGAAELERAITQERDPGAVSEPVSWQLVPDRYPCVALVSLSNRDALRTTDSFGIFRSERKARNALLRVASKYRLCHALLGIPEATGTPCLACPVDQPLTACGPRVDRLKHLERSFVALRAMRLPQWPYRGPVGIREGRELHIIDDWNYLGTARSDEEIHAVLQSRPSGFDREIFAFLARTLPGLPRRRVVPLLRHAHGCDHREQASA